MLAGLENQKVISIWQDRQIEGGENWYQAIREAIKKCDMALLLVSPQFLASPFIQREEVPLLLKQRMKLGLRVVPIIVRPCMWQDDPSSFKHSSFTKRRQGCCEFSQIQWQAGPGVG